MKNETTPVTVPVDIEIGGQTERYTLIITKLERRSEHCSELLGGDRTGLEAQVTVCQPGRDSGDTFFLSRLVGEEDWVIDAKFGANGFPHFSHGFGSRVTKLRSLLPEFTTPLDSAARERELARVIGRDLPLTLSS
ncbi:MULTISPECIES: hypothetical protein [unclassified Streptomyces]|uniref:hypothetical protein n=1 Tax=unclassified Streptomyces TaxID=2593676 RepID=UPI002E2A4D93|nr:MULTISPECIES: hypothetical protein [unclassified Streptomyces]